MKSMISTVSALFLVAALVSCGSEEEAAPASEAATVEETAVEAAEEAADATDEVYGAVEESDGENYGGRDE
ncbi:MAG: hypothetical protein ACK4MQ_12685 [Hyphomonas sp.]